MYIFFFNYIPKLNPIFTNLVIDFTLFLDGKVVSLGHFMPTGPVFNYVSCPHYFAEIVMYLSASLILAGKSYTWWLVCLWTGTNQIISGLISHQWYQKKFKNYPPERKAVIPFLL